MNPAPISLLHATSELHPFSKTGGLGDMVGALTQALARAGHPVHVITPLYRGIRERFPGIQATGWRFEIRIGPDLVPGRFHRLDPEPNLTLWFVEQPGYFDRPGIYNERLRDYADNAARFSFFSQSVTLLARHLPTPPGIVHAHDWQSALVPMRIQYERIAAGWSSAPKTLLTLHNLAYQGSFPLRDWEVTGLPADWLHLESALHHGQVNFLKGGIALADALSTVSPTYAREICTAEFGCGLDGLLRRREYELTGILNGVDYDEWNTTRNPALHSSYDADHLEGKRANKLALQQELGLAVDDSIPLFADVTRLAEQKGVDLLHDAVLELLGSGERMQFALLGSGDPQLETALDRLARAFPGVVATRIGFDPALAHRIEAGADFFVMPSRFEPCGLNQLYSLRYGTIPIVRATGGLMDSVIDPRENPDGATGIKFHDPTPEALANAMRKGISLFRHPDVLELFRRRGMRTDTSWTRQAAEYLDLYDEVYHGV